MDDQIPPHTATRRPPKKTDGPLSSHEPSNPTKKRKKAKKSILQDGDDDDMDTDLEADLLKLPIKSKKQKVDKTSKGVSSNLQKRGKHFEAAMEKLFEHIVGIDLGMWGFGKLLDLQAA